MGDFITDLSAHIQAHCETNPLWADTVSMATLASVLEGLHFTTIVGPLNLNIYALCIGPSGLANKTVPMKNFVMPILEKAGEVASSDFVLPSRFSLEGLIARLNEGSKKSSGLIWTDEFTHVLKEAYGAGYLSEILEFLSELYDGTAQKRYTKKAKLEESKNVFVNFLSATTPYIYEVMKPEMFLQGTANRFLFVVFKDAVERKYTPDQYFARDDAVQNSKETNDLFGATLGELRRQLDHGYRVDIDRESNAGKILLDFRERCIKQTREQYSEARPRDFGYSYLVRQPEICFKVAAIKAVSDYCGSDYTKSSFFRSKVLREILIKEAHAKWAVDMMALYQANFLRLQEEWGRHTTEKKPVLTLDKHQDLIRGYIKDAGGAILLKVLKNQMSIKGSEVTDTLETMTSTVELFPNHENPVDSPRYNQLCIQLKVVRSSKGGAPPQIVAFKPKQKK